MKHLLNDGRWLLASMKDLRAYFQAYQIAGRVLKSIQPACYDYTPMNFDEFESSNKATLDCAINTDGSICLIFDDDNSLEIEFSGQGPIILGYNTFFNREISDYGKDSCFSLDRMFSACLNKRITKILFERTDEKMMFPKYKGIDMSEDDNGIIAVLFVLDDSTVLRTSGFIDFFLVEHLDHDGNNTEVSVAELQSEIKQNKITQIPDEYYNILDDLEYLKSKFISPQQTQYLSNAINAVEQFFTDNDCEDFSFSVSLRNENKLNYISFEINCYQISISNGGSVYDPDIGSDSYSSNIMTLYNDGYIEGEFYDIRGILSELISLGAKLEFDDFDENDSI